MWEMQREDGEVSPGLRVNAMIYPPVDPFSVSQSACIFFSFSA